MFAVDNPKGDTRQAKEQTSPQGELIVIHKLFIILTWRLNMQHHKNDANINSGDEVAPTVKNRNPQITQINANFY